MKNSGKNIINNNTCASDHLNIKISYVVNSCANQKLRLYVSQRILNHDYVLSASMNSLDSILDLWVRTVVLRSIRNETQG